MLIDINKKWIDLYKEYYAETKVEAKNIEDKQFEELLETIKRKEVIIKKIDGLDVENALIQKGIEKELLIKIQKQERENITNANNTFHQMKRDGNERKKKIAHIKEYIK